MPAGPPNANVSVIGNAAVVCSEGNVVEPGREAIPSVGEGGLEGGGRTLYRLARVMTSRRKVASWNPGTETG